MYTQHLWHLNHTALQKAGWLSRCHWPQNKQHEITQKASSPVFFFCFSSSYFFYLLSQNGGCHSCTLDTGDEKDAPKDCRSNRVFQKHRHRPPLIHLMQCTSVLENNQYSRRTFWKTTPKCKNHFLGIKKNTACSFYIPLSLQTSFQTLN